MTWRIRPTRDFPESQPASVDPNLEMRAVVERANLGASMTGMRTFPQRFLIDVRNGAWVATSEASSGRMTQA